MTDLSPAESEAMEAAYEAAEGYPWNNDIDMSADGTRNIAECVWLAAHDYSKAQLDGYLRIVALESLRRQEAEDRIRVLEAVLKFYAQQKGLGSVLASDGGMRARAALSTSVGSSDAEVGSTETVTCPFCGGDGGECDDSTRPCDECGGSGTVQRPRSDAGANSDAGKLRCGCGHTAEDHHNDFCTRCNCMKFVSEHHG